MSSTVSDAICDECESSNAIYEVFSDSETGHIFECKDSKYMEVFRENTESQEIIENYRGYEHPYNRKEENN